MTLHYHHHDSRPLGFNAHPRWITQGQVLGHVAMWAVRGTLGGPPPDLETVLERLYRRFSDSEAGTFNSTGMARLTPRELEVILSLALASIVDALGRYRSGEGIVWAMRPLAYRVAMSVFAEADRDNTLDAVREQEYRSLRARLGRWWHSLFVREQQVEE